MNNCGVWYGKTKIYNYLRQNVKEVKEKKKEKKECEMYKNAF